MGTFHAVTAKEEEDKNHSQKATKNREEHQKRFGTRRNFVALTGTWH
jgi:hypothetical protein